MEETEDDRSELDSVQYIGNTQYIGSLILPRSIHNYFSVMDQLLAKAGSTLVTFAVRSGVQIASTYVIRSVGSLMDSVPVAERRRVERIKGRLENRIEIVSHAIQLIKVMASRGNTSLQSTLKLANELKEDIDDFHEQIDDVMEARSGDLSTDEIKAVELLMNTLVSRIDQTIPILNLALTTCGGNLSGNLNAFVSPGCLLKASSMVVDSNRAFHDKPVQVGPAFDLTMYDIFYNSAAHSGAEINWREKFARCTVEVERIKDDNFDYSYNLKVTESFDDDRYHDDEDAKPEERTVDLRGIARVFFSASGKLLKLEDRSSPVLVLKIRNQTRHEIDGAILEDEDDDTEDTKAFKWMAFGEYEGADSDSDDQDTESDGENSDSDESSSSLVDPAPISSHNEESLSTLEYLIRLCVLQASDQQSILEIKDERLRLYLNDENAISKPEQSRAQIPKLGVDVGRLSLK